MRLQTLASMSEVEMPFEALRDQINTRVDVIVQLTRHADGSRRITEIAGAGLARPRRLPHRPVARFDREPARPRPHRPRPLRAPPAARRRARAPRPRRGENVPEEFVDEAEFDETPERDAG